MSDDFYTGSARRRLEQIDAERAAALADLAAHKANSDFDSAGQAIQQIANLDAEKSNLSSLYQQYVRSQQPPPQEQLTDEQKAAKPWYQMNANDVYDMAKTSKFGVDENAFRAGMAEVQRRRARGE